MPVVHEAAARLCRAYAAVLFCGSPRFGAWLALLTCWSPRAALAGAIALAAALCWEKLLSLAPPGDPHLVNSLLAGLFLGAFHTLDAGLIAGVIAVSLLVTLLSAWLAALLWQIGRLPLLSFPFVLGVWMLTLATRDNAAAFDSAVLSSASGSLGWPWADGFLSALGWLLLIPYPFAGLLVLAGLAATSRYLALLALAGYLAGQAVLLFFGREDAMLLGFNFMLAAMAAGGVFAVPGRASFAIALLAAGAAALLAVAFGAVLAPWQLPLLTLPFVASIWLWLGALSARAANAAPILLLDAPSAPESSYERWRLARVRGLGCGGAGSIALRPPFHGDWCITQGFDGAHTHRDAWRHALDFEVFNDGERHAGQGEAREDYFCFGAPLLAPVDGQVVAARDDLPDGSPGEADVGNNWGNHVLLRTAGGAHVLLAHLRQGSLAVGNGAWVAAGQYLAACGSSGRSPVPHLHLHAQTTATLGAPTRPFHLANVLVSRDGCSEFRLCHLPREGDVIAAAQRDERLARALALPPGLTWTYRLDPDTTASLGSELTLLGQSRLTSPSGGSIAYEAGSAVLGCFDRQGPDDDLLDMWALALGLTPFSTAATCWNDRPGAHLLPAGALRRIVLGLLHPLGAACESEYRRGWDDQLNAWRQEGRHRLRLLPGIVWQVQSIAWIAPERGVIRLEVSAFGRTHHAELESVLARSPTTTNVHNARSES